jgi:2-polyprenyl-6-methoxyphenol hydroxylase-like FAD-dependent oxidoreductase
MIDVRDGLSKGASRRVSARTADHPPFGEAGNELSEREVIVAGAGPVGLWLAAELKIAGVDVLVLEKQAERVPHSRALAVYPRTLEHFAMRGLVERWLDEGTPVSSSHFALLSARLDFSFLDSRYPFTLFFPQLRTEELLEEHALSLGVPLLREHTVTSASQDDDGVTVAAKTPAGSATFRAQYVVGCEGGSSPIRKSAGIELVGSPATLHCIMGDVEVSEPPDLPTITLNGDAGAMFMVRLGERLFRVAPFDPVSMQQARTDAPTVAELRACVARVAGTDFGMHTARWLTRYGNATLQASYYRSGRLLLAGDSAHLFFPLGGQGLNLGLQDATNLAWKLAATVRGWAPPGLLDSYQEERHPVGADVVDDTLAQTALVSNSTREARALRKRFDGILGRHASLNRELALRLSGLATAYPASGAGEHPLTGRRVPDLALEGAPAPTVFGLLCNARFVLLDLTGGELQLADAGERADRLDVVAGRLANERPDWAHVQAVLIRPDGHVAWATDQLDDAAGQVASALMRWLDAGEHSTASPRPGEARSRFRHRSVPSLHPQ